jgi:hypothetical protein
MHAEQNRKRADHMTYILAAQGQEPVAARQEVIHEHDLVQLKQGLQLCRICGGGVSGHFLKYSGLLQRCLTDRESHCAKLLSARIWQHGHARDMKVAIHSSVPNVQCDAKQEEI